MSYCNIQIPTNATIIPVDTRTTSAKVLFLPSASTVGTRFITIKDYYGTARISSFTISTTGLDSIDGTRNFFRFTSSLQSLSLASDGFSNWRTISYTNDVNAYQIPFSPSSISSLALWVDASDPWNRGPFSTVVSTNIPIWFDKSGLQNNLRVSSVQSGILTQPSTQLISTVAGTFRWSIRQDATMQYAGNPSFISSGNTGTTSFVVFRGGGQNNASVIYYGSTNLIRQVLRDSTLSYNIRYGASGGYFNVQGDVTGGNYCTMSAVWAPSTQLSFYKFNGTTVGFDSGVKFRFNLSTNTNAFMYVSGIPNSGTGSGQFIGNISECLVYNSNLTSSQVNIVEGYLSWKWGIQTLLNPQHPYRFVTPSSYDVSSPTPPI